LGLSKRCNNVIWDKKLIIFGLNKIKDLTNTKDIRGF